MSSEGDEAKQEKGFVVIDRRGSEDEEVAEEEAAPETAKSGETVPDSQPLPELDFSTLVHSFAISALYHLGAAPPPEGEQAPAAPEINLPVAQQNIDILEILEQKTRGNLSDEESHLLESLLYELRMRFVQAKKQT